MSKSSSRYMNIFKSTFLFGFVQVFNILVKVGINKIVAVLLGPGGMGSIGLFQNSVNLLNVVCGLGINQSSIKDISEAREEGNEEKINRTITFVKSIIRYTSILGIIVTIFISPWLSRWTFGDDKHILSYILLSLMTGSLIQTQGFRAINTGMQQLKYVALSNLWGSVVGLVIAIPFYLILNEKGIVPSLVISSISTLIVSKFYANKVSYKKSYLTLKEILRSASGMIKMGISLMLMNVLVTISSLILSSYVSIKGGLEQVGIYQAGITIVVSYFAVIISAMSTEYYPRICSFNKDNVKLQEAVNAQSETGLIMAMPFIVAFVFFVPFFLKFLYSDSFLSASEYTDYAIIGTIMIICSNCFGMILIAKQDSKIFLLASFFATIAYLIVGIVLYNQYGLKGLGFAYAINGILQFLMYKFILLKRYQIRISIKVLFNLILALIICFLSMYLRTVSTIFPHWFLGIFLFTCTALYSLWYIKSFMGINFIIKLKTLFRK